MNGFIECTAVKMTETLVDFRKDFLHSLTAPADGMWENTIIDSSNFWLIEYNGEYAGYFCMDDTLRMLQLHIKDECLFGAQSIFEYILSHYHIKEAVSSTSAPLYLSLCHDFSVAAAVHSYLYTDHDRVKLEQPPTFPQSVFRQATYREEKTLIEFYKENTEGGGGEWIPLFIHQLIAAGQLFTVYDDEHILGTGECIASSLQKQYADLGVVVSQSHRRKGLGTYILCNLKDYCYMNHLSPICSCTYDNIGSKKAIEKSGFISKHRLLHFTFN